MNTPDTEWESVDEFAQKLSEKVRYFCGKGQYEENSDEQKAYIDGVETAIGMMYIDLTGTPKSKGMLDSRDTYWKERELEAYESGRRAGRNDIFKMNGVQELTNEDN